MADVETSEMIHNRGNERLRKRNTRTQAENSIMKAILPPHKQSITKKGHGQELTNSALGNQSEVGEREAAIDCPHLIVGHFRKLSAVTQTGASGFTAVILL